MNKTKTSNLLRSIAFFLTAVVLCCTFGFTVDGWIPSNLANECVYADNSSLYYSDAFQPDNSSTNEENESLDSSEKIYVNPFTGEKTESISSTKGSYAFVFDSCSALYGIEKADVLIEMPIENGSSRYVAISTDYDDLWKIGSIAPTRGYISNIAKYFCATLLSNGTDDQVSYNSCDITDKHFDFSINSSYCYTEQEKHVYTNCQLVSSAVTMLTPYDNSDKVPFTFAEENQIASGEITAKSIMIPTAEAFKTQLIYNSTSCKYSIIKNGEICKDFLSTKTLDFTNCFVLFADSTTYDNSSCNQMIMETIGSGKGFYITNGTATEIKWVGTIEGNLSFFTEDGSELIVNPGRSYISFLGTSKIDNIEFS